MYMFMFDACTGEEIRASDSGVCAICSDVCDKPVKTLCKHGERACLVMLQDI